MNSAVARQNAKVYMNARDLDYRTEILQRIDDDQKNILEGMPTANSKLTRGAEHVSMETLAVMIPYKSATARS